MKLETAKEVLALRRLEAADMAGGLLPADERRAATAVGGLTAVPELPDSGWSPAHDDALFRRTRRLMRDPQVAARVHEVMGEARPVRGRVITVVIAVLALAVGFLTNEVGGEKVINLLSIPMLGLLVWNALVYITLLVATLRGKPIEDEGHGPHRWVNRWLLKGAGVKLAADTPEEQPPEGSVARAVWRARAAFWQRWLRVLRREAAYWTEIVFHVGAASLVTGLVGGMYVRGLAFEYNAAWQSTFLEAPAVSRVLQVALGPAAALLRTPIPGPPAMQRLNVHDQEALDPHARESAAKWIHLYALTAALFIGLPRLGLAAICAWHVRQLHDRAPVERELREYFDALVREASGARMVAAVIPFSHEIAEMRQADIRGVLHRLFPGVGQVDFLPAIAYGTEEEWLAQTAAAASRDPARPQGNGAPAELDSGDTVPPAAPLPGRVAVVMNFSATPEEEVHGTIIREVSRRIPQRGEENGFAVIVDTTPFRRQFGAMPGFERRFRERRAAWDRLLDSLLVAALSEESGFYIWRRITAAESPA